MKREAKAFTTSETTILFPHLVEPAKSPFDPNREPRFECSFALSESDLTKLREIISTMIKNAWGNISSSTVSICVKEQKRKNDRGEYEPLLDEKGNQAYMLSSWSYKQPICVDGTKKPLTESDCYTGMIGHGIVNLYTLESRGRKFILAGLGGVVKTKEGTRPQGNDVGAEIDNLLASSTNSTVNEVANQITTDDIPF